MNPHNVTQCFAGTRKAWRVEAEVSRIPLMLRVPAVACVPRKLLDRVSFYVKLCVRAKTPFRIEGLSFSHGKTWRPANTPSPTTLLCPISGYRALGCRGGQGLAKLALGEMAKVFDITL
jgi:hypothetical protein